MDNKLAICLQVGLLALLGLRLLAPADAQEVSATPAERSVAPAGESTAVAGKDEKPQDWAFHGQTTVVYQYHPAFNSPYQGPHSLTPSAQGKETFDLTLHGGVRLWSGAELWVNPEVDQGFGLSDTLGVAGFPSGEAYKVGSNQPYGRVQRAFLRQTINLGGDTVRIDADLNQLAGTESADRVVITAGKFSVVDIFDTNAYAHDPRNDFLNWSIIDSAAFDYAANAWGYTYGIAGEWYQGKNAFRLGLFDLSIVPNSTELDPHILPQFQLVAEWERRYEVAGQPGIFRLLGFALRGNMGEYDQATEIAQMTGEPADIAAVRSFHTKYGMALNLQQQLASGMGLFVRISADQGQYEAYEFTDVNRSYALGFSMTGERWSRPDDNFGAAVVVNCASSAAQRFFDAGGLGILVGDGQLPHPGSERLVETYYSFSLVHGVRLSLDYQFIDPPAYNRDRGPVSVFGLRFHAQL
ncbi:MAG TPA: carbohydrate porin [Burkholderiales bacterium]|nr:carbohydrate porin [Burkholderiales bacterium]